MRKLSAVNGTRRSFSQAPFVTHFVVPSFAVPLICLCCLACSITFLSTPRSVSLNFATFTTPRLSQSFHLRMDETGNKDRLCANCGKAAEHDCGKCETTWYCGRGCQKEAWSSHKTICGKTGTDLVVHRAGQLLQDVYLMMREMTFDNAIKSIQDRGEYLLVRDDQMIPGTIFPFPSWLIHNDKHKKMVLTTLICQEPTAFLHDFLKEMLDGECSQHLPLKLYLTASDIDVTLEEHNIQLKKPAKTVRIEAQLETLDMNKFLHSVVIVKSSDKAISWVIDVSGSQYSIFEACLPKERYYQRYVSSTSAAYKYGVNKAIFETIKNMRGDGPLLARIGWHAAKKVNAAVSDWKVQSKLSLPELLRKDERAFVRERKKLMETIKTSLSDFAADVAVAFREDIKNTYEYSRKNFWKSSMGLCPFQDVADATERISQAHRLY